MELLNINAINNGLYDFEPNRPTKNIDVLRFVLSRTYLGRMSNRQAVNLAAEEIKKCWISLGQGLENDFLTRRSFVGKIDKLVTAYRVMGDRLCHRTPSTGILIFLQRKKLELDIFLNETFFPLSSNGTAQSQKLQKMTDQEWVRYKMETGIRPVILAVPSFDSEPFLPCLDKDYVECPGQMVAPSADELVEEMVEEGTLLDNHHGEVYLIKGRNAYFACDKCAQTDLT